MDKFYHSVRLDEELCKGCINCIKRCPTQAIRVQDGKARINKKFCIDCGECIRVCPHHAKHAVYDQLQEMERFRYKVALPAPSLYSQFNNLDDINIVLHALLLMGFDDVFEVSAAAELVSEATRSYLTEHEDQLPLISTACPSVVRLIRVRFGDLELPRGLRRGEKSEMSRESVQEWLLHLKLAQQKAAEKGEFSHGHGRKSAPRRDRRSQAPKRENREGGSGRTGARRPRAHGSGTRL